MDTTETGPEWDFEAARNAGEDVDPDDVLDEDKEMLQVTVFNLEVEDFHTYFAGKHGVWVHNKHHHYLSSREPYPMELRQFAHFLAAIFV